MMTVQLATITAAALEPHSQVLVCSHFLLIIYNWMGASGNTTYDASVTNLTDTDILDCHTMKITITLFKFFSALYNFYFIII